jgi:hypothetical protein
MVKRAIDTRKTELDAIHQKSRSQFQPYFPDPGALWFPETELRTGKSGDASLCVAVT